MANLFLCLLPQTGCLLTLFRGILATGGAPKGLILRDEAEGTGKMDSFISFLPSTD